MALTRAACHVHSDWSYDGSWRLDEIARAFAERRYEVVLLAEHDRGFDQSRWEAYRAACAAASNESMLLVPGIEYSDAANAVHVPVWGDIPFLGEGLETGALLDQVQEAGGLAVLAHPARREVWSRFDPAWQQRLLGIELWNRKYDGYAPGRVAAEFGWEESGLLPFVSLDFHSARQFHPLAMLLDLDGGRTEGRVCAALEAGRVRPTAFGLPALGLARGPALPVMGGAERARRTLARRVRRTRALGRQVRSRG